MLFIKNKKEQEPASSQSQPAEQPKPEQPQQEPKIEP